MGRGPGVAGSLAGSAVATWWSIAVDEVPAWVSANHQFPVFPQLQKLCPQSIGPMELPGPTVGGSLTGRGLDLGPGGLRIPLEAVIP